MGQCFVSSVSNVSNVSSVSSVSLGFVFLFWGKGVERSIYIFIYKLKIIYIL